MANTSASLSSLILSAAEVRELTGWPDAMIEDYLNIFRSLVLLADNLDEKSGSVKEVKIIDTTPYTPDVSDDELFVDTSVGDIYITLPPGEDGFTYRIINTGFSKNRVYLVPALTDLLFGLNENEFLIDAEVVRITFKDGVGWY
jgi:hypothetical protein